MYQQISQLQYELAKSEAERDELRRQLEQQAVVIEQTRSDIGLWERSETPEEIQAGEAAIINAMNLQPCPEVLNKVRADAVRNGLSEWENTVEPIYKFMQEYAQRIEKGEA